MNAAKQSARDLLEATPLVMRFIRERVRQRRVGGLSLPQFRTLAFLDAFSRASLSEAAGHVGLSLAAMSRLVDGLVADGLVGRKTVSTNRRQVALTLTARGRTTLEKIRDGIRDQLAGVLKELPAGEHKAVQRAMRILQRVFDSRPAVKKSPAKARR